MVFLNYSDYPNFITNPIGNINNIINLLQKYFIEGNVNLCITFISKNYISHFIYLIIYLKKYTYRDKLIYR